MFNVEALYKKFLQELGHIFLGQGKYAVDILRRFPMEDCRPMSTPMVTNWKKLHAFEGELVDPTLYCQLIGSLMYLVNSKARFVFCGEHSQLVHGGAEESALGCRKTCVEIPCRYNGLWSGV